MEEIVLKTGEANSPAAIASRLSNERAADVVEALNELEAEMAAAVLLHLPTDRAIEVLDLPGLDRAPEIVQKLPIERAVPLLTGMRKWSGLCGRN